eukprot:CAMPEP_0172409152 /NCGR_PEP_ID=MMETSP1061-20121228/76223_1 /TAXON_ID=37318 /ORGANISM="Pseudo-nitzschia pungens, Strain cf. pungens" /LENGTH=303 /DNA_ID=CAMNT_0013145301 /DNA_START=246 /DNA_END=1154 /DNA_ORIENTATION=+
MSSSSSSSSNPSCNPNSDLPRIDGTETIASTRWLKLETLSYTDIEGKQRKWDRATRTTKKGSDSADAVVIIPLLKRPYPTNNNNNNNNNTDDNDNNNDSDSDETLDTLLVEQYRQRPYPTNNNNTDDNNNNNDSDSDETLDTLLVEQYRPPVGRATLEFPAGLIDEGETPEQAALRELREETGYVGEACKIPPTVSKQVCMSPGLADETVHVVVVTVDLDNPYNRDVSSGVVQAQPDEGEHITVHRVGLRDGLLKAVLDNNNDNNNNNNNNNGSSLSSSSSSPMAIQGLYLFALGLEIGMSVG